MTVRDVWKVAPQSFVFIRGRDGRVKEYCGSGDLGDREVDRMKAVKYPMYDSVIEIVLKD